MRTTPAHTTQAAPAPRWASQEEAAGHLGITVKTLRRYIAEGRITGYRFGPRLIRVDLGELDALMKPIPTGGGN